ncbi:MAG TPA: tetratricopeptide repeat protein [Methylophilaceae bacterium]
MSVSAAKMKSPTHNAQECYRRALTAHQASQWQQAESAYLELLAHNPQHPNASSLLGTLYLQLNMHAPAAEWLAKAAAINPRQHDVWSNLANALLALSRFKDALTAYNQAIALKPDHADGYINRANVHHELLDFSASLADAEHAIRLEPDNAVAHNLHGNALLGLKRNEEAIASYDTAIRLKPDFSDAFNNRANALRYLQRPDQALESYNQSLNLKPDFVDGYFNRGMVFEDLGRFDDALTDYEHVLSFQPQHAGVHWNKSAIKLLKGEWEEGWKLYETRWTNSALGLHDPYPAEKRWDGKQSLLGKTILIHTEQGMGDTIQFCRYVPLLVAQGAQVALIVAPALKELISTLPCAVSLISNGEMLPAYDFHYPLLSLPFALNTTLASIPDHVPYLSVTPAKGYEWKAKVGISSRPKIGVIWNGAAINPNDRHRSMPLEALAPLLAEDYTFHCLQKEIRQQDQAILQRFPQLQLHELSDFTDTAALIEQMDLVISVCTSVGHLTGALNKPLWVMLTKYADWRWLEHRADCPWYPSARLFRQQTQDDWSDVVNQIITTLHSTFPAPTT